jgi:glycerol-3-phosphate acyltransferase PlsX
MNIIIDCGGGDFAPLAPLQGAIMASQQYAVHFTLVGDESVFASLCESYHWDLPSDRFTLVHTPKRILMTDDPLCVVREKADSSLSVALKLLSQGQGDALVSAGNTGALHAGAALLVRRIRNISRAAIAALLPLQKPTLLLDAGANTTLTPYELLQFAKMGSIFMRKTQNLPRAQVGLINIGTEAHKGTALQKEVYPLLQNDPSFDFFGNVEGSMIPSSPCDVLVTDGFCGNLVLKLLEGFGSHILGQIKEVLTSSTRAKAGAALLQEPMQKMLSTYRAATFGGAPLLGISRPIIKAHGNSNAEAICAAVGQAIRYASAGVISEIATMAQEMPSQKEFEKKEHEL